MPAASANTVSSSQICSYGSGFDMPDKLIQTVAIAQQMAGHFFLDGDRVPDIDLNFWEDP